MSSKGERKADSVSDHGLSLDNLSVKTMLHDDSDKSLFDEAIRKKLYQSIYTIKNLRDREKSYKLIIENTTDAVIQMDSTGNILFVNPSFTNIFGYQSKEILNKNIFILISKRERDAFKEKFAVYLKNYSNNSSIISDYLVFVSGLHREGHELSLEVLFTSYNKKDKTIIVTIIRDLTQHQGMAEELQASKDSYWALSETTTDTILQIDENFDIVFANSAVKSIFGYTNRELKHKSFAILFPRPVYERYEDVFRKYFLIDDEHRKESRLKNTIEILGQSKSSEIIPLEISFGNSKSVRSNRILTCIVRDITQRKKTERKLRYLAFHDKLTELGNRDLFNVALNDVLNNIKRDKDRLGALLFLDLDGFKKVNDTLGHDIGDKILIECARRLGDCLRKSDYVYRFSDEVNDARAAFEDLFRFGGDEFVIVLSHLKQATDAAVVAQRIINSVRNPYNVDGYESISNINLGVSVGIAIIPQDGDRLNTLISNADVAMYKAKELGNRYVFFTKEMNNKATERLMLEDGLRNALNNNKLDLYYQPLVDSEGIIKGMEALLRWYDKKHGFISPDKFIPVAEETGLIIPIGDWVFETACRHLKYWNANGYDDIYMSINLSAKQFEQENLVNKISEIIKKTGVNPANIKIEVTESSIMNFPEAAIAKMDEIKKKNMDLRIAIDDFGTGYSCLSYLINLPVDIMKIDRAFVINLPEESNTKIISTIITLAHSLDMEVVAEGVETEDQLNYLSSLKCQTFQGFYFSRAVSAQEMSRLLKKGRLPPGEGLVTHY